MQFQSRSRVWFWSLTSFAITVVIGSSLFTAWEWIRPCPVKSQKKVWGSCYRDLQASPLTIGIAIGAPIEDYNSLAAYLQDQLGSQVEIDKTTPFKEISERIARRNWDIAFTLPIFSIAAEANRYTGVAVISPNQPPYYRAALYVRSDSSIQSIADIKSTTTIAL